MQHDWLEEIAYYVLMILVFAIVNKFGFSIHGIGFFVIFILCLVRLIYIYVHAFSNYLNEYTASFQKSLLLASYYLKLYEDFIKKMANHRFKYNNEDLKEIEKYCQEAYKIMKKVEEDGKHAGMDS